MINKIESQIDGGTRVQGSPIISLYELGFLLFQLG